MVSSNVVIRDMVVQLTGTGSAPTKLAGVSFSNCYESFTCICVTSDGYLG